MFFFSVLGVFTYLDWEVSCNYKIQGLNVECPTKKCRENIQHPKQMEVKKG